MKRVRELLGAVAAVGLLASAATAEAKSFKFAFQGDVQSLDPYSLNETFTLGFLGNVYEGLSMYDENLQLIPALAESWSQPEPDKWVFRIRKGVKFHAGGDLTADDVIFSWQRALTKGSDQKLLAGLVKGMTKIDDFTVEAITVIPTPTLMQEFVFLYIMDKEWAEQHNTTEATNVKGGEEDNYANLHANGTGPFTIESREPDVRSVFKRAPHYWGSMKSNVTEVVFTPVTQDSTRVAALIAGDMDLAYPVPVQDWKRLEETPGIKPLAGPEARTIFLGMDQFRDELLHSDVKGKNPFKDIRVRQAFAHALNLDAIKDKVMRGASIPTGLLVAPQITGFNEKLNTPYAYDLEKSKTLLAEAGYPDGFTVTMDCPNNRYVNDENICLAVAGLLAKVGIKVDVNALPKSKFFAKVREQGGYDTSFYLLGWTPGTMDSHNVMNALLACQNKEENTGQYNIGNYCNARVTELTAKVGSETDPAKRQAMIDEAFTIAKDDFAYLPLHQQPLSWGVREGVAVAQRADNILDFRYVVMP